MADDIVTRLRYAARACNHGLPNGAGDSFPDPTYCGGCLRLNDAADEIERLHAIGDRLAEQVLMLLGPLSTDADPATVERHRIVRAGALAEWAEVRRG